MPTTAPLLGGAQAPVGDVGFEAPGMTPEDPLYQQIKNARSTEEIQACLSGGLEGALGRPVGVDLTGAHLYAAKEAAVALLHVARIHPESALTAVSVAKRLVNRGASAEANHDGHMVLNIAAFGKKNRKVLEAKNPFTRLSRGDVPMTWAAEVVIHEMGHMDGFRIGQDQMHSFMYPLYRVDKEKERSHWKKPSPPRRSGILTPELITSEISAYAATNERELYAEAFTDVIVNGKNAGELSQGIYRRGQMLRNRDPVDSADNLRRTLADLRASTYKNGMPKPPEAGRYAGVLEKGFHSLRGRTGVGKNERAGGKSHGAAPGLAPGAARNAQRKQGRER
ncbi:hypothetical protein ACIBSV_50555 [Embleya sp. NPDC050154]